MKKLFLTKTRGRFTLEKSASPKVQERWKKAVNRITAKRKMGYKITPGARFTYKVNTSLKSPSVRNKFNQTEKNILAFENQLGNLSKQLYRNYAIGNLEDKIYEMKETLKSLESQLNNHKRKINSQLKPLQNKINAAHKRSANLRKLLTA